MVNRYAYDSFGAPKSSETIRNAYAYTGREYDSETGLYYYRARYYDPEAGRFVSKDPIGFAGGDVSIYGYVLNNPFNWIDPSGLSQWKPVPGNPRWEWRDDYDIHGEKKRHRHFRHKGKEIPRKIDPETGKQKPHAEGRCTGPDKDVPQDVVDAVKKAINLTGNPIIDLFLYDISENFVDVVDKINRSIPEPPILVIPIYVPIPVPVPIIP